MAVHLGQTAVGVSVGRVSVHLGAGSPESCRERVRDCPSASVGAMGPRDAHRPHRAPRRQDALPKVASPIPARVVAQAQVVALKVTARCLVLPRGHPQAHSGEWV